jgi:hypothetical protein
MNGSFGVRLIAALRASGYRQRGIARFEGPELSLQNPRFLKRLAPTGKEVLCYSFAHDWRDVLRCAPVYLAVHKLQHAKVKNLASVPSTISVRWSTLIESGLSNQVDWNVRNLVIEETAGSFFCVEDL